MRVLAISSYVLGVLAVIAAFLGLMASGNGRRELLSAGAETLLPALVLFLGGLLFIALGRSLAARGTAHAPNLSANSTVSMSNSANDPRLDMMKSMGIPVKKGDTFEKIAREVVQSGNQNLTIPTKSQPAPKRARVEVIVPPVPSSSWLGGRPSLPSGTLWPTRDQKPATFIAQIALHDLPSGIWADHAPKDGWLVIFVDRGCNGAHLLHTTELGSERDFPSGYENIGVAHIYKNIPALQRLFGDPCEITARWPVRILPEEAPPSDAERPDALDDQGKPLYQVWITKDEVGFDLRDPDWAPFDVPLVQALLEKSLDLLTQAENVPQWRLDKRASEGEDLEKHAAKIAELGILFKDLLAKAEAVEQTAANSHEMAQALFQPLRGLQWSKNELLFSLSSSDTFEFYESYARHQYARDPALVPLRIRGKLEPYWKRQAEVEVGFIGGDIRDAFRHAGIDETAVVLDIPSSSLIGWEFGDASRLGVFLSEQDFSDRAFHKSVAKTTHGYM